MKSFALGVTLAMSASSSAIAQESRQEEPNILLWPMPETVSPEGRAAAEAAAKQGLPDPAPPIAVVRQMVDGMQAQIGAALQERYDVRIQEWKISGVPVRIVFPKGMSELGDGPVLLNLHGGGGKLDSGSLTETIPIAALTGIPVVAVLYRLAPEHPYPARLNDALTVYQALEKGRPANKIGVYGTSAGAVLSGQLVAQLTKLGRPMPAALGFFSGTADASRKGDSESWMPQPSGELAPESDFNVPKTDPVLSPIFGDLSHFPPTLLVSSTRDLALSGTSNFGRALLEQGVGARFVVFDGMPHAFWTYMPNVPETDEANDLMAKFLAEHIAP